MQDYSQDFQKRGSWDPAQGLGAGGELPLPAQNMEAQRLYHFESLRMALVITLHHTDVQLSSSNHTIPVYSRVGMVVVLGFKL